MDQRLKTDDLVGAVLQDGGCVVLAGAPEQWRIQSFLANVARRDDVFLELSDSRVIFHDPGQAMHVNSRDIASWLDLSIPESDLPWLSILVDMDKRRYVNGYFELPLERSVPESWTGLWDDPYRFAPTELVAWWANYPVGRGFR